MKTLIIGNGEIGKSLKRVLEPHYDVYIKDILRLDIKEVEVLHICFPYSKNFVKFVKEYKKQYKPKFCIIHSTVPMGTSKKLNVYHSPIRGIHPNLEKSILTFVKYLAPKNKQLTKYFEKAGIKIKQVKETQTTELAKILSTTKYGIDILFNKEAHRLSKKYKADFNIVYRDWTLTYNEGYFKLGHWYFMRPILKYMKGKIGGHCVIQNCELLDSYITRLIKKRNG